MSYSDNILEYVKANLEESKQDFDNITEQIRLSDLNFKNWCIKTLAAPKVFTTDDEKLIKEFVANCFSIFNKVISRYIDDPEYRRLFPYSKELEDLVTLPAQYSVQIPMARVDFFFNEETKDIKLCEINTDGASAMNEVRIFNTLLPFNSAFKHVLGDNYRTYELFDTWINEFMKLWDEHSGNKPNPKVAIVDFLDKATLNEFTRFKEAFERRGIDCIVCDIRELEYDGITLSHKGRSIDIIYRRAVTSDIVANIDEVRPFITAVRDNNVCIVGGFRTQIIHNKASFIVLHSAETNAFLSEEEKAFVRRHVPITKVLSESSANQENIFNTKDNWIIKPFDLYASKGVHAGVDYSNDEWCDVVRQAINTGEYLLQEFTVPYRTNNIDFSEENPKVESYCNMTGAFCYNENVYAVYSRLSKDNIIIPGNNEKVIPTVIAK